MITMKNEEHMVNELYKLLDNLRGRVDAQEALEFIYILKAWEKLSNEKKYMKKSLLIIFTIKK